MKRVEDVTVADFAMHPVWEYVGGEPVLVPVTDLPVDSLQNRIVGVQVHLANGACAWASLCNISLRHPRSTGHFLTVSIEKDGAWFHLARYHDVDYDQRGPNQLAEFLGLPISSIFPIEYDLTGLVDVDSVLVKGAIPLQPQERLSEDELIQLALDVDEV
ncbi:MAG TPA: hypothetical protein DD670_14355 [Planctomycetaceae bacterium]|nr:hypothetical protein [Planctomycetaceae bacterium]